MKNAQKVENLKILFKELDKSESRIEKIYSEIELIMNKEEKLLIKKTNKMIKTRKQEQDKKEKEIKSKEKKTGQVYECYKCGMFFRSVLDSDEVKCPNCNSDDVVKDQ